MNPDQEEDLQALLKQRQATLEKGQEISAVQEQLRQESKRRMEDAQNDRLINESSAILDAMMNGTMSHEEAERRLSQLENKAQAK